MGLPLFLIELCQSFSLIASNICILVWRFPRLCLDKSQPAIEEFLRRALRKCLLLILLLPGARTTTKLCQYANSFSRCQWFFLFFLAKLVVAVITCPWLATCCRQHSLRRTHHTCLSRKQCPDFSPLGLSHWHSFWGDLWPLSPSYICLLLYFC